MERPTSEKVALLERVLNRIRENARDTVGRSRFVRGAPEPKKGVSVAQPAAPPPTLALSPELLPDATPVAVPLASPPAPPVTPVPSPPAPPVAALDTESTLTAGAVITPAEAEARPPSAIPAFEDAPTSASGRMMPGHDLAELQAGLQGPSELPILEPEQPQGRSTQALFGQPEEVHVDVAFDENQKRVSSVPPPVAAESSPPPAEPHDITGVHPIAPGGPRAATPASFSSQPLEVDLASTIELPAAELASAVHTSSREGVREEKAEPASSPRLRTSPVVDDDTYPAVSPSSLPPLQSDEAAAASFEPSPIESQVGVRSPSGVPAPYEDARAPSELPPPPPPLRRSEMPRPPPSSQHEIESVAAATEPQPQPPPHMVVSPAPAPLPRPEPLPAPVPLGALALEADSFGRTTVQGGNANFVAAVRSPAPRTFGELLEASLSLGTDL